MEWELHSGVHLKEYRNMFLEFPVVIHLANRNLLQPKENSRGALEIALRRASPHSAVYPGAAKIGATDAILRLRYDYVEQSSEEEEIVIDDAVVKRHELADPNANYFFWAGERRS